MMKQNKYVEVMYELYVPNETGNWDIVEKTSKEHPLKEPVVKELLGYKMTVEAIHHELIRLSGDSAERRQMLSQYDKMIEILGEPGAPARAADVILGLFLQK